MKLFLAVSLFHILAFQFIYMGISVAQDAESSKPKSILGYFEQDFYKKNSALVKNEKFLDVANFIAVNDVGSNLMIRENSIRLSPYKGQTYIKFLLIRERFLILTSLPKRISVEYSLMNW